jgi:hypothetical protein
MRRIERQANGRREAGYKTVEVVIGHVPMSGQLAKGSKAFFSEEKKQKTFTSPPLTRSRPRPGFIRGHQRQKFFGSRRAGSAFFSRNNCFLCLP